MCNRFIYSTALQEKYPDAKITHKVGIPFTAQIVVDGKKGGLNCCGNGSYLVGPYPITKRCFKGQDAVAEVEKLQANGGAPTVLELVR